MKWALLCLMLFLMRFMGVLGFLMSFLVMIFMSMASLFTIQAEPRREMSIAQIHKA